MRDVTISRDRLNTVVERICDDFCHWPIASSSQEALNKHCEECPLNNIECDDYWEERDNA